MFLPVLALLRQDHAGLFFSFSEDAVNKTYVKLTDVTFTERRVQLSPSCQIRIEGLTSAAAEPSHLTYACNVFFCSL